MKRRVHTLIVLAVFLAMPGPETAAADNLSGGVRDNAGRVVHVAAPFDRIVSLYGAHTENLFTLDAGRAVMGVSRHDRYPAAVGDKPVFSYHDGLERFLAASPDLVLIRPMIDRGYAPLIAGLEKNGIAVLSLQPGSIPEMYAYWRTLGRLTGREDRAAAMVTAFRQAVVDFKALTASVDQRKRVYFEAIHKRMKTFTPGSMPIFALETAGGLNVAADAVQVRTTNIAFYGKERILSRAGDIDVYLAQRGAMNQPTRELIRREPGYEVIKAVRDNQIFVIDEALVARPTWRLLHGIHQIGILLYPEHFQGNGERILREAEAALGAAEAGELFNMTQMKEFHEQSNR